MTISFNKGFAVQLILRNVYQQNWQNISFCLVWRSSLKMELNFTHNVPVFSSSVSICITYTLLFLNHYKPYLLPPSLSLSFSLTRAHTHSHSLSLHLLPFWRHPRRQQQLHASQHHHRHHRSVVTKLFNWRTKKTFFLKPQCCYRSLYRKLVMVCLRVNLCNNWCIFWLSETTKTPLGFALYTQGILFRTDAFQRVYNKIETGKDAFETISIIIYHTVPMKWDFVSYFNIQWVKKISK